MKTIHALFLSLLALFLATGSARAQVRPPDTHIMCNAIPVKDQGTLLEPCTTFYEQRSEAIAGIKAIILESTEALTGELDSATQYGKVQAFQATVSNFLTAFQMACESVYGGGEYPKELAEAIALERDALTYAMSAYSDLAWVSAVVTNDVYGFNKCRDELAAKFEKMEKDDFIPADKLIYDALHWKVNPGAKAHVEDLGKVQNALIIMSTMMRTLENWKTGYKEIIDNSDWDERKEDYHTEHIETQMLKLAELYTGKEQLNEWNSVYLNTKDARDQLEYLYKDNWEGLKEDYEKYFQEGDNLFAWFRHSGGYKVDFWNDADPYETVKKLHAEIVEVME